MRRTAAAIAAAAAWALGGGAAAAQAEACVEDFGARACLEGPVDRYGHAVLGATPEWSVLSLTVAGARLIFELPEAQVYEDVAPRIVDLGGDGTPEVVVVEASRAGGARLAVYGLDRGALRVVAATPEIGTRNRWLAPAAWTDLNGDGVLDLAYVDRPHLAGVLRAWTFAPGGLTEIAAERGFSNHRVGDAFILSGVRDCGEGPEVVLPDFGWSELRAARLTEAGWAWRRIEGAATREGLAQALAAC
ncbi:MAG: VCBS repeat-containing protein [Pseudomonadota bacterium]